MRATSLNMIYELAKRDKRVLFIGSDLSPGLLDAMRKEMPERWYMEGVSEANVVGMAAGLAMEGYHPLRQHDSHFHYAAMLRAGGGRSLPP